LRLQDVLEYQDRRRVERRIRVDEMTRQAVDDGLYEDSAADYQEALRQVRGKSA
jgi:anti-sigma-K factor RskA